MIQIGDDDLVARPERLPHGETDEADERGRVHAEGDFLGAACIEERRHSLARALDGEVHGNALRVAAAALHVVLEQMPVDRLEHDLRYLGARGVVEKDEWAGPLQRRKLCAQGGCGERRGAWGSCGAHRVSG